MAAQNDDEDSDKLIQFSIKNDFIIFLKMNIEEKKLKLVGSS